MPVSTRNRRACRHCKSPARENPCWWSLDHPNDGGDPPCMLYDDDESDDRTERWPIPRWLVIAVFVGAIVIIVIMKGVR